MKGIELNIEHETALFRLKDTAHTVSLSNCRGTLTTEELARVKARCERFLALPLIQALNSEGL